MARMTRSANEQDITPLRSTVVPRYRQVEALLRDQIWLGEFGPGDQLPTEESLCRQFAVSRATVRQALQILEQDGLIHREAPRGTFVNPAIEQGKRGLIDITSENLHYMDIFDEIAMERSGSYIARGEIQTALQMPPGSEVFFFLRVFYLGGEPVGGEQVYVPSVLADALSEDDMIAPAISSAISKRLLRRLETIDFRLSAIVADARHAIRFETLSGAPLISILRTSYDSDGGPIEHGHMVFRCDRCQLTLQGQQDVG